MMSEEMMAFHYECMHVKCLSVPKAKLKLQCPFSRYEIVSAIGKTEVVQPVESAWGNLTGKLKYCDKIPIDCL